MQKMGHLLLCGHDKETMWGQYPCLVILLPVIKMKSKSMAEEGVLIPENSASLSYRGLVWMNASRL